MQLRFTVYDVVAGSVTDNTIGMYLGDLLWGYGTGGLYAPGFIDRHSFSGLTQSATNITSGGTFSNGFTGAIGVRAYSDALYNAWKAGTIQLLGRYARLEIYFTEWTTLFYSKITAIEPVNGAELSLSVDTTAILDSRKLPLVTITKEMALNKDSDAVGQVLTPVFGNKAFYKMVFCEVPDTIAALVSQIETTDTGNQLWQASVSPIGFDYYDEFYQLATPDLTFMRGKSLLQCVGTWQAGTDQPVWVALSYNGKQLLATAPAESNTKYLRTALVGRALRCVHGRSQGDSYTITDILWATHEVERNSTDIETIWIQLDLTDLAKVQYVLPSWSTGSRGDGNRPLLLSDDGDVAVNELVGPRLGSASAGSFLGDVTYFSFEQAYAGLFIVSNDADLSNATVLQQDEESGSYIEVAQPSAISVVYQAAKWKLISLEMNTSLASPDGSFQQITRVPITTWMLENYEGSGFGSTLNSANYLMLPAQTSENAHDTGISTQLTSVPTNGLTLTSKRSQYGGLSDTGFQHTQHNTFYVRSDNAFFADSCNLSLIPDYACSIPTGSWQPASYTALLTVEVYAISEANIAVAKKSYTVQLDYGPKTGMTAETLHIDPVNRTITISANCTSHIDQATTLYTAMERALSFSSTELATLHDKLNGFVVYVKFVHTRGSIDQLYVPISLTKTVKPLAAYTTREADKKKLWLKTVKDTSVHTPIGLIRSLATLIGAPYDADSLAEVENAQRTYFATSEADFDGMYVTDSNDSFSAIVDKIAKGSMTAVYVDSVGVLRAKFLPTTPALVSHTFTADDIERDSDSYGMPNCGYLYTDYDFSVKTSPIDVASVVTLDTDSTGTFPAETAYALGAYNFNAANGYTITGFNAYSTSTWAAIRLRGTNKALFGLFVPGSYWQLTTPKFGVPTYGFRYTCRLDNVAPDIGCDPSQDGIALLFKIETVEQIDSDFDKSLQTFGPSPLWRALVSGTVVDNYALASALWGYARTARLSTGQEIKAPQSITKVDQPIWGSDKAAIARWITETVKYGSIQKLLIKFTAKLSAETALVQYLDYVSFAFGQFEMDNIQGHVIERTPNVAEGKIAFTLLCHGDQSNLPTILTELDESIVLETGELLEPEDTAQGSVKISEMTTSSAASAAAAGAYTVVAIQNVANNKVTLTSINTWITDGVLATVNTALAGKANAVHTHAIGEVTGLQTALDGKAATSHTHAISDVSGLQAALNVLMPKTGFVGEHSFANGTYVDPDVGVARALKIGAGGVALLGGLKADSATVGGQAVVVTSDARLSDARTPTSHVHGNITNAGAIGSTSGLPIITTTSGVLTVGSFGTAVGTFCQGNDTRLSDARTPTAHNQDWSTITTGRPTTLSGYGITNAIDTGSSYNVKSGLLQLSGATSSNNYLGLGSYCRLYAQATEGYFVFNAPRALIGFESTNKGGWCGWIGQYGTNDYNMEYRVEGNAQYHNFSQYDGSTIQNIIRFYRDAVHCYRALTVQDVALAGARYSAPTTARFGHKDHNGAGNLYGFIQEAGGDSYVRGGTVGLSSTTGPIALGTATSNTTALQFGTSGTKIYHNVGNGYLCFENLNGLTCPVLDVTNCGAFGPNSSGYYPPVQFHSGNGGDGWQGFCVNLHGYRTNFMGYNDEFTIFRETNSSGAGFRALSVKNAYTDLTSPGLVKVSTAISQATAFQLGGGADLWYDGAYLKCNKTIDALTTMPKIATSSNGSGSGDVSLLANIFVCDAAAVNQYGAYAMRLNSYDTYNGAPRSVAYDFMAFLKGVDGVPNKVHIRPKLLAFRGVGLDCSTIESTASSWQWDCSVDPVKHLYGALTQDLQINLVAGAVGETSVLFIQQGATLRTLTLALNGIVFRRIGGTTAPSNSMAFSNQNGFGTPSGNYKFSLTWGYNRAGDTGAPNCCFINCEAS